MIRLTEHARERCESRNIHADAVEVIVNDKVRRNVTSAAVLVVEWNQKVVCADGSNGDEVWVIIRGGRIVTVMLRRKSQRDTVRNLDVDVVIL